MPNDLLSERAVQEIQRAWLNDLSPKYEGPLLSAVIAGATGCDEAVEIIQDMQWRREELTNYGCTLHEVCVECENRREKGHAPDCRLAAYLSKYGPSKEQPCTKP